MKLFCLLPLLFLAACSTTPKLTLRPQEPPPSSSGNSAVRYPEVIRPYHFGRYVDPNDDLVMHEEHTVYRVEENTRWDLHIPATRSKFDFPPATAIADSAFSPLPVNDAILAEVNAQKLATIQIMTEARVLSSALAQFQSALQQTRTNLQETAQLRATIGDINRRLEAIESTPPPQALMPPAASGNEAPDPLNF